jgi:hypothetical protein
VRDNNNNNALLLSQTWVIAKATVLRVRTVPYVVHELVRKSFFCALVRRLFSRG